MKNKTLKLSSKMIVIDTSKSTVQLELDREEAQLVLKLLEQFSGKPNCPPGCITAAEIGMRLQALLEQ